MREFTRRGIEILANLSASADSTTVDTHLAPLFQNAGLTTEEIVSNAIAGNPGAHLFLCRQAGEALASSQPMPRALEAYIAKVLLDEFHEAKRGKGRPTEWLKNFAIVHALERLNAERIPATRNEATDDHLECGCRIVAEMFTKAGSEIGEPGVAKVWERYRDKISALQTMVAQKQK